MATISWAVAASGDWHTRADWSGGTLPGAGDDVLLATPGAVTVTHSSGADTVASLTATTDRLDVTGGSLRVTGTADWQAGLLLAGGTLVLAGGGGIGGGLAADGGTLSLAAGSAVAVTGTANLRGGVGLTGHGTLSTLGATRLGAGGSTVAIGGGVTWNNAGTATLSGIVQSATAATITNAAGARLVLASDAAGIVVTAGRDSLANAGTLAKTGGTGTSEIEATLTSTGTIDVASGTLLLTAAATLGGTLTGAGTLELAGRTTHIADLSAASGSVIALSAAVGATLTGSMLGSLRADGGQIVASGSDTVAGGLTLTGGDVFVSAGATLGLRDGSLLQGGATLSGQGLLDLGGVASVGADGLATRLVNLTLTESGAMTLHAALDSSGSVQFTVAAAATLALDTDAAGIVDLSGRSHLTIAGTLAKLAGSGSSRVDGVLASTGTLDAASGTLDLDGSGSIAGVVKGAGTLLLDGGDFSVAAGTALQPAALVVGGGSVAIAVPLSGTLGLLGGQLELQADGQNAVSGLAMAAGTLTLDHGVTLAVAGAASLGGGTVAGTGLLSTAGATGVSAAGVALGSGLTWLNGGTVTATGVVQGGSNDSVTNQAAGVIELAGETAALLFGGTLTSAGTLAKTAGRGVSTVAAALASTGTVMVASGTLALDGGGTLSGSIGGAGTLLFGGGSFGVAGSTAVNVASLAVGDAAVTVGDTAAIGDFATDALQVTGGSLLLAGGAALAVGGGVLIDGAGTLGGDGTLATAGGATLGADGQAVALAGGLVWDDSGTIAALAGVVTAGSGSVTLDILPGGGFDFQNDLAGVTDGGSVGVVDNAGTLAKTGGDGTSTLFASLVSTGTVLAASGTLALAFSAQLSGTAGGAGGLLLLQNGASSTGALAIADNGRAASVQVSSGYVSWSNDGSVTDAGQVLLGDGSGSGPVIFTNAAGATWAFSGDDGGIAADGPVWFSNAGLLEKTGGDGLSSVAPGLANGGTVDAAAGTLALLGTVTGSGTLQIDSGATLELGQAPSGTQAFRFPGQGGVLRLDQPASIAGPMQGFGAGDGIDFAGLGVSAASVAGDMLSVTAAGTLYGFTSSQSLAGLTPQVAPDGSGGSLVTLVGDAPAGAFCASR